MVREPPSQPLPVKMGHPSQGLVALMRVPDSPPSSGRDLPVDAALKRKQFHTRGSALPLPHLSLPREPQSSSRIPSTLEVVEARSPVVVAKVSKMELEQVGVVVLLLLSSWWWWW